MKYFAKSDIGNHREQNEDFYWCGNDLFIVADGMGGHTAGEIASRVAVESFVKFFLHEINKYKIYKKNIKHKNENKNEVKDLPDNNSGNDSKELDLTASELSLKSSINSLNSPFNSVSEYSESFKIVYDTIKEILEKSIRHSNKVVYTLAAKRSEYSGMGTTLTGCFINSGVAGIVHVGDSRLYIKHQDKLELVTSDHTVVGEMYRNGLITYEEMFRHPLRNYLNNVLGLSTEVASDLIDYSLIDGDILVLCTDGLNSMLKDNEIAAIINKFKEPQKITEQLISSANKKGGLDNTTVITILI
ncbi:MAG: serine/threonine-protein phosphatase [Actinobacteria bacterium]|nr:serine/threonine-protein phosphatase [Actinomycetota bacterium]